MDPEIEAGAHLLLTIGRRLLGDGAETEQVATTIDRVARSLGYEAHLLVTYEALLLTLMSGAVSDERFRTKAGRHLPGFGVNMRAVEAIDRVVADLVASRIGVEEATRQLDAAEPAPYPRLLIALAMGVTAACLARLFGGDPAACATAGVAGTVGTLLRLMLVGHAVNPFLIAFLAALIGGLVGAIGADLTATATAALCVIAPSMILVPGVPLINGVWDCARNHMSLGVARLTAALLTVLAIATGLFCVTIITRVPVPIGGALTLLPLWQDALFAGIAAVGFALLFNVPPRLIWAAVLCGAVSHALRTQAMMVGAALAPATLIGSAGAGVLALALAWRFRVPPAAFAFPGVVAMVPGSFAFRAVIGAIGIVQAGDGASPHLLAETIALTVGSALAMAAIAVGLALPLALMTMVRADETDSHRQTGRPGR